MDKQKDPVCNVCLGDESSVPGERCICGGGGTIFDEVEGLRRYALELEAERNNLVEVLESVDVKGPDKDNLVWVNFTAPGCLAGSVRLGYETDMWSLAATQWLELKNKALKSVFSDD